MRQKPAHKIVCTECKLKADETKNQYWFEDSSNGAFYCEFCMDKLFISQLRRESSHTVH